MSLGISSAAPSKPRLIAWPLLLLALLSALLAVCCILVLSAARAYVGGEGLYSRAQKAAAAHLARYAETRAPADWAAYEEAIRVPLGDRQAREALEKPDYDFEVARQGFIAGLNHPDDVTGLILLFRWCRQLPFMDRTIRTWAEGDRLVAEMVANAQALHRAVEGGASPAMLARWRERIHTIDAELTPLEYRFSAILGEAARLTETLLIAVVLLGTGTMATLSAVVMQRAANRSHQRRLQAGQAIRQANQRLEQRVLERTQELQDANERLLGLDRMKSQFVANMSHELRTPLNAIIGFTKVLQMGMTGPLTPQQQRQIGFVHDAGQHLLALINDLLDLSRIESGHMELHCEAFDFAGVVSEAIETVRPLADVKSLELRVQVTPPLLLQGDRRKIYQVLLNLLANAVKFTERGHVAVSARADGALLDVGVSDTGPGMSREQMGRLFEAFTQLDGTLTRNHEGTGLGLYLSRKLLELMGGEIGVRSTPGEGSSFHFSLPLVLEAPPAVTPAEVLRSPAAAPAP